MSTPEMIASIESVPAKIDELRKAYDLVRSFSSALVSFNIKWKDLEEHFASIQNSIDERMKQLDSRANQCQTLSVHVANQSITPRPELVAFCTNMDGLALRSYIVGHRSDMNDIRDELGSALAFAPDPAKLIVDALDGDMQGMKRICLNLLEQLRNLEPKPEISNTAREIAKKIGHEWKTKIVEDAEDGENGIEALTFLELLDAYHLVMEFDKDDVLDVFILVSRRKQATQLCKNLGLGEHMADLIKKLSSKGRQLDAVKFIHYLNLADKFPLVPLLKEYLKDSRRTAQEVREKGNNSKQAKNEAIAKEIAATKAVIKAIEDYKLQSQYSCNDLNKRIKQLEQQKANKKRSAPATGAAASNIKPHRQHLQNQPNKRPRPMTSMPSMNSIASSQYAVVSHHLPPLALNQTQLVSSDQPQYQMLLGAYSLSRTGASSSVPIVSGSHYGLSRNHSPSHSRSHLYSAESLMGSGGYDLPVAYGSYAPSSHTTSSLYPKGI